LAHQANIMLDGIREDLSDPAVIDEFVRRFQAAMRRTRRPPTADNGKLRTQVQKEIANLTDAIASGALRGSPRSLSGCRRRKSELASLEEHWAVKRSTTALLVPDLRGCYLDMTQGLDGVLTRDPERGREELRGILGEKIKLRPRQVWSLLVGRILARAECFAAEAVKCGYCGSGGRFVNFRLSLAA
jgi:hypothetical protein